ncbi:MAG: SIMPL domain-containing protein [Cyanobacteriota bacterium ELA615]
MKKAKFWLMVVLISLLASLMITNSAIAATDPSTRTLTVTGVGIKKIATSITQIEISVEIQDKSATKTQQEMARRTNSVLDFLRSRKVEQLQSKEIRLEPNYQYNNNKREMVGYIGTNAVSFRTTPEQLGTILDGAVNAGATSINGLSMTASEEVIISAQKKALELATIDAQQKAEVIFKTLNLKPKEVSNIQINSSAQIYNGGAPRYAMSADKVSSNTTIIGAQQDIEATVTLQISY